jgi:hypothetical protein
MLSDRGFDGRLITLMQSGDSMHAVMALLRYATYANDCGRYPTAIGSLLPTLPRVRPTLPRLA